MTSHKSDVSDLSIILADEDSLVSAVSVKGRELSDLLDSDETYDADAVAEIENDISDLYDMVQRKRDMTDEVEDDNEIILTTAEEIGLPV